MLPNFYVVGAQKSATTSIHHYLMQHPEIYLPEQKETKFFVDDNKYHNGLKFYEETYFSDRKNQKIIGEIDPDYMYFEDALDRMVNDLEIKELKFVFILRNPVDRAFSHYLMTYRRGLEKMSFSEAIKAEAGRIRKNYDFKMHYSYVTRGYYHDQIKRFLSYIDSQQIYIMLTEELKADPGKALNGLYGFLGITNDFLPDNINEKFHKSMIPKNMWLLDRIRKETFEKKILRMILPSKIIREKIRARLISKNLTSKHDMKLSQEMKTMLSNLYKEKNILLSNLIDKDLSHWDYH